MRSKNKKMSIFLGRSVKAALLEAAVAMPAVLAVVSAAATLEVTPAL